jgi:restriction system protein
VTQRRVGELVRGVFQILFDHSEGLPAKDILERMKALVPPTDFEKSAYPNKPGVQRYGKMIRFATIAPVKAG